MWLETFDQVLVNVPLGAEVGISKEGPGEGDYWLGLDPCSEEAVRVLAKGTEEQMQQAYARLQTGIGRNTPIVSFYVAPGRD